MDKEGFSQCGHFAGKEGVGQLLAILCGHLLWTAANALFLPFMTGKIFMF